MGERDLSSWDITLSYDFPYGQVIGLKMLRIVMLNGKSYYNVCARASFYFAKNDTRQYKKSRAVLAARQIALLL